MIRKITVLPETNANDILLCKEFFFDELPNIKVIPLFGPNGAGKTTLINAIENSTSAKNRELEVIRDKKAMAVLKYQNSEDNFRHRKARSIMEDYDPSFMLARWNAGAVSEGQSIIYSTSFLFDFIGTGKYALKYDDKDILVLIDEIDSGLSIDNLDKILRKLRYSTKKRSDIQIIFSFNNPYILRYFPDVISLYSGHAIHLANTDEMMQEIKKHEKEFRKLRYKSDGTPKIPK